MRKIQYEKNKEKIELRDKIKIRDNSVVEKQNKVNHCNQMIIGLQERAKKAEADLKEAKAELKQ